MKKNRFVIRALFVLLISLIMVSQAYAETGTSAVFTIGQQSFTLNGEEKVMDVAPYIRDGRTFMPVRYVANALGIADDDILWDGGSQTVTLSKGDKIVKLVIGSNTILVNDQQVTMDVPPQVAGGRTMLPIGHVAAAFGAQVSWNAANQTVTLLTGSMKDSEISSPPASKDGIQTFGFDDITIMGIKPDMPKEELFAVAGMPTRSVESSYVYPFGSVDIMFKKVIGIFIDTPGYKGPRDIQVGDSLESVLAKFPGGQPYRVSDAVGAGYYLYGDYDSEACGYTGRTEFKNGHSSTQVDYHFIYKSGGVPIREYILYIYFEDDIVDQIQLTWNGF